MEQAQHRFWLPRGRARLVPAELGFGRGHRALVPHGVGSSLWDRVFVPGTLSHHAAVECAVLRVAHLDVTFRWAGDALASLAVGTALAGMFPSFSLQKQAGKTHPMGMWCQAGRC